MGSPAPNKLDPTRDPVRLKWAKAIGLGFHAGIVWFFVTACAGGTLAAPINANLLWVAVPSLGSAVLLGWLIAFGNLRLQRDRQRRERGLCLRCGYDLRASTLRCPECGRRISR